MQLLLELNKRNLDLSKQEALALIKPDEFKLVDNYLFINTKKTAFFKRLAYTKHIFHVLFISSEKDFIKNFELYNWKKIYYKNFSVRTIGVKHTEKELASIIWKKVSKPKVKLSDAETQIIVFKLKNKVVVTKLLYKNKENFNKRKSHNLPEPHPSSLHPQLARAMINLSGAKKTILDPFCGAGSILIEAGLMGLKPVGSDIDRIMINRAKINLNHFKIRNYKVKIKDALTIKKHYNHIVTDLPYARNTKAKNLEQLYIEFLKNIKENKVKTAVIGFPDFINHKTIIKKAKLKIKKEFTYYLHKTLSKKIVVIQS